MGTAQTVNQFRACVMRLKEIFEPYHTGQSIWVNEDIEVVDCNLSLPPWICQPYIRMEPEKHLEHLAEKERQAAEKEKIEYFDDDGRPISKKLMKKLVRASRKPNANGIRQKETRSFELCSVCPNPTVSYFNAFIWVSKNRLQLIHAFSVELFSLLWEITMFLLYTFRASNVVIKCADNVVVINANQKNWIVMDTNITLNQLSGKINAQRVCMQNQLKRSVDCTNEFCKKNKDY